MNPTGHIFASCVTLLALCCTTVANAACPMPHGSMIDDPLREHRPGFTACNASSAFLRRFKLPMRRAKLEAALGAPGVDPATGAVPGRGIEAYRLHWDGPHSFWNADVVDYDVVKQIEGSGGDGTDLVLDLDGLHRQ
jgi:hypothetical protein